MHTGEQVPAVAPETRMPDVIYEMSRKGMGHAAVVTHQGRLVGIISDGDLRRVLQREGDRALSLTAQDCMTRSPVTISRTELATKALSLMEGRKITSLLVIDAEGKLEGVVHIHDLWTTQMF
jgi:arabinose-5-phosphate isomerase